MLKLPQGYTLHAYAVYDNTASNPLNPNDPPQDISWCDYTTCEMFFLPFSYVPYQEGDENIYLGNSENLGCTNQLASNYDALACFDDNSCNYCDTTSVVIAPVSESFESATSIFTQATYDNTNWTRDAGGTTSSATGPQLVNPTTGVLMNTWLPATYPNGSADGDYYMYLETSGGIAGNISEEKIRQMLGMSDQSRVIDLYEYISTTEIEKVPATILSRCLQLNLRLLSEEEITKQLSNIFKEEKISFDDESLKIISKSASGSMRDALTISEKALKSSILPFVQLPRKTKSICFPSIVSPSLYDI